MMKRVISGIAAMLTLAAIPAAAAPIDYDCDTAADHFSQLKQALGGGPVAISGTLTARAMASSKTYAALTQLKLASADGADGLSIKLLGSPKIDKTTLMAMLTIRTAGKDDDISLGPVSLMEAVPFSIHVDATGAASVTLGRWRRDKIIAPAATANAEVICSTGEFLYEKLDLGAK